MEPFEDDKLTEAELDAMLPAWDTPDPPVWLRSAVFPKGRRRWWQTLWGASVRIPLPAAVCLLILAVLLVLWRVTPQTIYRDRVIPMTSASSADTGIMRPVTVLKPRIIRSSHVQN